MRKADLNTNEKYERQIEKCVDLDRGANKQSQTVKKTDLPKKE